MEKLVSESTERLVLGIILGHPANILRSLDLEKEDFHFSLHQRIFVKIGELFEQGTEITPQIVIPYFMDDMELEKAGPVGFIFGLISEASGLIASLKDFIIMLKELRRRRLFVEFLNKYQNSVTLNTDVDLAIAELEDSVFQQNKKIQVRTDVKLSKDIVEGLTKELQCYSTGYPKLDSALGGGIYASKGYCLVARQKTGKTAAMGSISYNMARKGVKHLYVAVEMGAEEIYKRTMAYMVNRNPLAFVTLAERWDKGFQEDVAGAAVKIARQGANVWFADAPGIHFDDLKRLILSHVRRHDLKGVIIDYIQIIGGEKKGENKSDFFGRIAQWLADVLKQEDIFVIAAVQENAEGDVKWSKAIPAAMDISLYMKRPDNENSKKRWFETRDSRYTVNAKVGNESQPSFEIGGGGVFLTQLDDLSCYEQEGLDLEND